MQRAWPSFPWICYAMCVGVMGTALASPLYPLYQATWSLPPSTITQIFVAYMVGVLVTLLFVGQWVARIGFLPFLRSGLVLMCLGLALSALANGVPLFTLSRVLIGVASGLISSSAAVGLAQSRPHSDPRRISAITTVAMTLGFGLGPLVGGLIAQWAPAPLVSTYLPSLALGVLAVVALFRISIGTTQVEGAMVRAWTWRQWLPRIALPPHTARRAFWLVSMGGFSAFGIFSLYASLAPSFMQELVPWHGPAISGAMIAAILFLSSAFQFGVRNWRTKTVALCGYAGLVGGNLLLVLTSLNASGGWFVASVVVTAFGHALACVAGMSVVGKLSRGGASALLSTYLIVGYLGTIVPILAMGWLSDHLGLARAVVAFALTMAALNAALIALGWRTREIVVPPPGASTSTS